MSEEMINKRETPAVELLAPAGSFEMLKAVIAAGADAVYIGGDKFGARAFADNPDQETLLEAIDYVHLRRKRIYLTVNTLLKEKELREELYPFLLPLYKAGLDAVIVQDMGVMKFISACFPGLAIHASTQMTITGAAGARLLEQYGVTRVVTARELSLEEIRKIRSTTSLEIESFVHGALCYCYSGQCLLSSMIGGRSGNRGRCAQPCRLPYALYSGGEMVSRKKQPYLLSPKDMNTIHLLPEIISAGVYSLKIEGRMKKPAYAAGVVHIYRKYLDRCLEGGRFDVSVEDEQALFDLFNRDGFHEGYYKRHNGQSMMALENKKASDRSKARNEALFKEIRERFIDKEKKTAVSVSFLMKKDQPVSLSLLSHGRSVQVTGSVPQEALSHPMAYEDVAAHISKLGGSDFYLNVLEVRMDDGLFLPVRELNQLRRDAFALLKEEYLKEYRRGEPQVCPSFPQTPAAGGAGQKPVFSVSVTTAGQLKTVGLFAGHLSRVYVEYELYTKETGLVRDVIAQLPQLIFDLALPYILRDAYEDGFRECIKSCLQDGFTGFLVRNMEELAVLREADLTDRCTLDANMYTWNSFSQAFYRPEGIFRMTAPCELNRKELRRRDNHDSELIIYGYQPLMISAQCAQRNTGHCDHGQNVFSLKDRTGTCFRVECHCDFCYNMIYNSLPLGLLDCAEEIREMNFASLRLSFTSETPEEMQHVSEHFLSEYEQGIKAKSTGKFTRGHYKRGVD